jgi:hypothetical protein
MKMNNYALFDTKIGAFLRPFICQNDAEAIRLLTTWVNEKDGKTNISKYPEHFILFYIGTFDDQNGILSSDEKKELMLAISVQEEQERQYTVKELITLLEQHFENKTNPPLREVN